MQKEYLENNAKNCNLKLVSDIKFPDSQLPRTYERGKKCLDMLAISEGIPILSIKAMWYLPFSVPMPSNHRAVFVDLDTDTLFGTQLPDLAKSSFRHFTTKI